MAEETKECPFCAETIRAAAKKCRYCGEWMPGQSRKSLVRDYVGGDDLSTGDVSDVRGLAQGRESMAASTGNVAGSFIQAAGPVTLGKELRDEQYAIALNWRWEPKSMREFDLSKRDLTKLKLANADLRRANLQGSYMRSIDLSGADISRAYLCDATLRKANLSNADLGNSDLSNANLRRAKLINSDLHKAILKGVNLTRADLNGANLDKADLSGARFSKRTKWPEGFNPIAVGAILVDDDGNPIKDAAE